MTLFTIIAALLAVAAFAAGWFRGYQKACDAHGWKLPSIDWKSELRR